MGDEQHDQRAEGSQGDEAGEAARARAVILERRRRFVAAALTSLTVGAGACDGPPLTETRVCLSLALPPEDFAPNHNVHAWPPDSPVQQVSPQPSGPTGPDNPADAGTHGPWIDESDGFDDDDAGQG